MKHNSTTRRGALTTLLLSGVAAASLPVTSLSQPSVRTAQTAEGPYYPRQHMRFADQDNDLVYIQGADQEAQGERLYLTGTVYDRRGQVLKGARIEIWQVDYNARYLHTADPADRPRDPYFQGFGSTVTNEQGQYIFRTIRPVEYPGRTPHIHAKVLVEGRERLTTQFYVDGLAANQNDFLWRSLSPAQQQALSMRYQPVEGGSLARVDIRL